MSPGLVDFERAGHVGLLQICNPPLNILTADVKTDFTALVTQIRGERDLRALILTGNGDRAFCAGADLGEEEDLQPDTVRGFLEEDRAVYDSLRELSIPVIAAVNGYCMGGGFDLALAADIRLAAEEAQFCAAGVKVGLVSNTTRLTKLFGPAVARDLALTGRTIDGKEAARLGVVTLAVPRVRLLEEAQSWARTISERAPLAVAKTKHAIAEAADLSFNEGIERELDYFIELSKTRDHKHAIAAFFKREQPVFHGR
jgi:enoyl-CoA hydratase